MRTDMRQSLVYIIINKVYTFIVDISFRLHKTYLRAGLIYYETG